MIEIEVHGFNRERGKVIGNVVQFFLKECGMVQELAITIVPLPPPPQETLRVRSPGGEDISEIIRMLKDLSFRVLQ